VLSFAQYLGLNLIALEHYYFDTAYWRDDYRGVAKYVMTAKEPSVMLWGNIELLRYYGDQKTIGGNDYAKANLPDTIRRATGSAESILVVMNREFYWGTPGELSRSLADRYKTDVRMQFPYFTIYHLQADNESTVTHGRATAMKANNNPAGPTPPKGLPGS
jgi:hypothetical protein